MARAVARRRRLQQRCRRAGGRVRRVAEGTTPGRVNGEADVEEEGAAAALRRPHSDVAPLVQVHDRLAQCQAQARALALLLRIGADLHEVAEQPGLVLRRDAAALVCDHHRDVRVAVSAAADPRGHVEGRDGNDHLAPAGGEFARVADEVADHVLDAVAVTNHLSAKPGLGLRVGVKG